MTRHHVWVLWPILLALLAAAWQSQGTVERPDPGHPWLIAPDGTDFIAMSHEGNHDVNGHSTIAGFVTVRQLGIHYIETDVRLVDGVLVLGHIGKIPAPKDGKSSLDVMRKDGAKTFPLLSDAVAEPELADVRWNFELKAGEGFETGEMLRRLMNEPEHVASGLKERVCISVGINVVEVHQIRDVFDAGSCFCASVAERALSADGPILPSLGGMADRFDAALAGWKGSPLESQAKEAEPVCFQAAKEVTTSRDVREAHGRGLFLTTWPILPAGYLPGQSAEGELRRLIRAGVDGIATDDPCALLAALDRPTPDACAFGSLTPEPGGS